MPFEYIDEAPRKNKFQYIDEAPVDVPKEQGFSERLGTDIDQRAGNIERNVSQGVMGEITPLQQGVNIAGNFAGAGLDVLGNVIGSGARGVVSVTPEVIKRPIRDTAKYIAESPVGDAGRYLGRQASELSQQYPQTSEYFGNVLNLTAAAPAAQMTKTVATKTGKKVGEQAVKGLERLATPKQVIPNAEQFKAMGAATYKRASESGEVFSAKVADGFVDSIEASKPKKIGGAVETRLATDLERDVGKYKDLRGKNLDIDEIDIIDKDLSNLKDQAYSSGNYQLGNSLADMQNSLRGSVIDTPAGGLLKEARDTYRRKFQMDDIERIFRNAEGRPNEAAVIQTGFRNLANQARKKGSGYSKEQIKLIDKAAKGGASIDALKLASSRLIPIIAGTTGGAIPAVGGYMANIAAGAGATALQTAKGSKVAKSIAGETRVAGQPTLVNRAAQDLLKRVRDGKRLTPRELNRLTPREVDIIMRELNQLKNTKK